MSLTPPAPEPERHEMVRVRAAEGEEGTQVWTFRGVTLKGNAKGSIWNFRLPGLPMGKDGFVGGMGNAAICQSIISTWLDHRRLPPPYVMPKVG